MRMAMDAFRTQVAAKLARLFRPREILIRANGRVRYFALTQRSQMTAAGLLLTLIGGLMIGGLGYALQDRRLAGTEAELRRVEAAYRDLATEMAAYEQRVQAILARPQGAGMADLGAEAAADQALATLELRRAEELRASEAALAAAAERDAVLVATVRTLRFHLLAARRAQARATRGREADTLRLATLADRLAAARAEVAVLETRLDDSRQDLAAVVLQRDILQASRVRLSEQVFDLEERLDQAQTAHDALVEQLAARARDGLEKAERTIAMTGLNVDTLLRQAAKAQQGGQGGPFIPAGVVRATAGLDDVEVERWERLQVVLRTLPLAAPLDSYRVTSRFGERTDPVNGEAAIHEGIDMAGALRSPVLSTAPGRVVFAGWKGSYGRMVEIDHGLGIRTRYGHLRSIAVKVGDRVEIRQKLGVMGSSGRSTGTHVHYEVLVNGKPRNPTNFLKAGGNVLKG